MVQYYIEINIPGVPVRVTTGEMFDPNTVLRVGSSLKLQIPLAYLQYYKRKDSNGRWNLTHLSELEAIAKKG